MDAPLNKELLISREEIGLRIAEIAKTLDATYDKLTVVMIMKGAFILVADLVRAMSIPVDVEFIQCISYRGTMERGPLTMLGIDALHLADQDVLIVDDVVDSGETLLQVRKALQLQGPKSLHTLVLLGKKRPRVIEPDYTLFDIEDNFIIGYGLDLEGYYRGLPDIYTVT